MFPESEVLWIVSDWFPVAVCRKKELHINSSSLEDIDDSFLTRLPTP